MKRLLSLFVLSLLLTASLRADVPCAASYEAAKTTVVSMRLGRGLEVKLLTKIENAWRMSRSGKKNAQKNALQQLHVALGLLERNSTKQLPPDVRTTVQNAINAFRSCLEGGNVTTATVMVKVVRPDVENPSNMQLVEGAIVRVNGEEAGTTSSAGTLTVEVPAGEATVEAIVYPSLGATSTVDLAAGAATMVELLLDDDSPRERATLVLDEAPEGALAGAFSSFTLRFLDPLGNRVPMATVEGVDLLRADGSGYTYWANRFTVAADGSIRPTDINAWRGALAGQGGKLDLSVTAMDARGRLYFGRFTFHVASITVAGRLVAPPSNPALNVGGVPVFASILNTDLVFRVVTAADGSFTLPPLPRGNLEIEAHTVAEGKSYYGDAVVALTANVRVIVNMLYPTDKVNGVPLYRVEPLTFGVTPSTQAVEMGQALERERLDRARRFSLLGSLTASSVSATADTNSASVSVTGAARDQAITRTATLTVPQGTPSIILRYEVRTAEYPNFVLAQSIFNDWWYLEVTAATNGARLFRRLRQINSQLSLEPIWQTNGSTGELQYELDTQTLTQFGPADVTVLASTANVGDGALATSVDATLSRNFNVSINFIDRDTVSPTDGLSDRFSIPRAGETNHHQRSLTFGVLKPSGSTVTNVKVSVNGVSGFSSSPLQPSNPIIDETPGTAVTPVAGTNNFRARVTFEGTPSPFTSTPPQAPRIRYKIKVTVNDNGAVKSAERETEAYYALWRMPDGLPRYGYRDVGGDNWCSLATYHWLETNGSLISRIDDVSGEHARDIGHDTHFDGRDIDIFHYHTMPGAWNGESNYDILARNASRTMHFDPDIRAQARAQVTAWVSAMRNGLTPLNALTDVDALLTNRGTGVYGLPYGWAWSLLSTGTATIAGQQLDLSLGPWNCAKCQPRTDHEDHTHIRLIDSFF